MEYSYLLCLIYFKTCQIYLMGLYAKDKEFDSRTILNCFNYQSFDDIDDIIHNVKVGEYLVVVVNPLPPC